MTDDRLARLEAELAMQGLAIKQLHSDLRQIVQSVELLGTNDTRIAEALNSIHRRLMMQEAGTAMYEVTQDRSLN